MTADGDSQDEAPAPAPFDETRRSDASVDERGGRYKFGSIYFEESRIKCKYMLCNNNAPGACTPEEVLAEFVDAFGLELPSMCFRGLGANGWWESGFSTLDFQAQLDAVAGQVRSRSQEESDQRLMSLPDERARTALAAWGTLTLLDKNIVDNKVVTAAKNEEVAHALPFALMWGSLRGSPTLEISPAGARSWYPEQGHSSTYNRMWLGGLALPGPARFENRSQDC